MTKKDFNELALTMHEEKLGKVGIQSKVKVGTKDDLSTAYTGCCSMFKNKRKQRRCL